MLTNFAYNAQYYARVKDLCLGINTFAIKLDCFIIKNKNLKILTVLLEYFDLLVLIFFSLCWNYACCF